MEFKLQYRIASFLEFLSDFWFVSGKIVTAISLFILPTVMVSYVFISRQFFVSVLYYDIEGQLHSTIPYLPAVISFFSYFQIFVFLLILAIYPPYPFPYPIKWYFMKRGYSTAVREYEFTKSVLYIVVPLFIFFTFLVVVPDLQILKGIPGLSIVTDSFDQLLSMIKPYLNTLGFVNALLFLIVISGILKIILAVGRREFRLFFARGCFVLMQDAKNEIDEMRYFVMGLNSYNLYLRRQIKLEIKDLNQAYSKIATIGEEQKNNIVGKFASFFLYDRNVEENTLFPLREISMLLEKPQTELLAQQQLKNKLKEWGAAAAIIIPLIIQIIALY